MVCLRDISFSQVSIIKELWEKNRKYHENLSEFFGDLYSDLVFEERIKPFSSFDKDHIKITLAEDNLSRNILGYCISTFKGIEGETQTLHVAEEIRGSGIGKSLMDSHIKWLQNNGCKDIAITVAFENTNTIEFYKTLGFKANTIEMRLK